MGIEREGDGGEIVGGFGVLKLEPTSVVGRQMYEANGQDGCYELDSKLVHYIMMMMI